MSNQTLNWRWSATMALLRERFSTTSNRPLPTRLLFSFQTSSCARDLLRQRERTLQDVFTFRRFAPDHDYPLSSAAGSTGVARTAGIPAAMIAAARSTAPADTREAASRGPSIVVDCAGINEHQHALILPILSLVEVADAAGARAGAAVTKRLAIIRG